MFDIDEFNKGIQVVEPKDILSLIGFIKQFDNVVLWGAGNLGNAIGKKFIELGIPISCYWDQRSEITELNGIHTFAPLGNNYKKEKTIVVMCIASGYLNYDSFREQLLKEGFIYSLDGMRIYEALICPFGNNQNLNFSTCYDSFACSKQRCKRFSNAIENGSEDNSKVVLMNFALSITNKCSLRCTFCNQGNKDIPKDKKIDVPFKRVIADIDGLLDSIDTACTFTIMGGEPFIHHDFIDIVKYCCTKKNTGLISIATNGIWNLSEDMLKKIKNDKVRVTFSDYSIYLSSNQQELFKNNINKVKKLGIRYIVNNVIWYHPQNQFVECGYTHEHLINMKRKCEIRKTCSNVFNGIYAPCGLATAINVEVDCVDLTDKHNLNERIRQCINKPYYEACKYCSGEMGEQIPSGEQAE